eukprot:scaffold9099_cov135-Isochrysis_galbana.AAC.2
MEAPSPAGSMDAMNWITSAASPPSVAATATYTAAAKQKNTAVCRHPPSPRGRAREVSGTAEGPSRVRSVKPRETSFSVPLTTQRDPAQELKRARCSSAGAGLGRNSLHRAAQRSMSKHQAAPHVCVTRPAARAEQDQNNTQLPLARLATPRLFT